MKTILSKRIFAAFMAAALVGTVCLADTSVISCAGFQVNALESNILKSGSCGEYVRYEFSSDGTLTLSGSGGMYNYERTESPFYNNDNIRKVVIGTGITDIGESLFLNCSRLCEVEISDTVTKLGWNCFYGCCSLTDIEIPESVAIIDTDSFDGCINLRNVTIPDSVEIIGEEAFYGCFALADVRLPKNLKSIGRSAFRYCHSLTSIELPESMTEIDAGSFFCCTGLESVTIPDSIVKIGSSAFSGCTSLREINIPDSVVSIDNNAFRECSSVTELTIPDSVTSLGSRVFSYCSSLQTVAVGNGLKSIPDKTFLGCTELRSAVLGDSIEEFGNNSFESCTSLKEINIPSKLTVIPNCTFNGCKSLDNVTLPSGIAKIGEKAFADCKSLKSIAVPANTTSIDDTSFWNCSSLEEITVDSRNKSFSSSDGILFNKSKTKLVCYGAGKTGSSFTIPSGVTRLGKGAFYGSRYLQNVVIPGNVKTVGKSAFYGCTALKSARIDEGVTTFGDSTFFGCVNLTDVNIPESTSTITFAMFRGCSSLKEINVPCGITLIDNFAFYGCRSLRKLPIPDSCTSLGNFGFYDCDSLRSITIPESVKSIGYGAFGFYYDAETGEDKKDEDFIIYGFSGSAAERYALDSEVRFEALTDSSELELNRDQLYLDIGKTFQLKVDSEEELVWSTDNIQVAAVADGKVTAKGAGSARITVKTSKGETAVCIVTVTEPIIYAETVKFDKSEISVESGKTVKLKAEILPFDTTDASLTWSSSNNAVVTVTDGIVTARAAGAAAITAVTSNGKAASCVVFVTEPVVEPETIVMNKTSLYLKKGTKQQIKAVIAPENVTDKTVTWTTSDRSIATVSNGMITAQSPGIVTIKATSCNGLSASCTVIVYTTLIEAESVSMNREEITIKKGTKFQLKSIFTPADTTNKTVDWITSDKSIATVSNGRVTAQSVGKAVITVKTSNGKTAVCYVTVI